MESRFSINYRALLYNMPLVESLKFAGHIFNSVKLPDDISHITVPENNLLYMNGSFLNCCIIAANGRASYVVATPEQPIEVYTDFDIETAAEERVKCELEKLEEKLVLITNFHICFTAVVIEIYTDEGNTKVIGHYFNRVTSNRMEWLEKGKLIEKRLVFDINWKEFEAFVMRKESERYQRALTYYIGSFSESSYKTSFCMLITSLDALFGNGEKIKQRIAKYTSILLCEPGKIGEYRTQLKTFYKKRSDYVHGKRDNITKEEEWILREYVRKILISIFLMWDETKINSFKEFYKLLDNIEAKPSLYVEKAVASYTFVRLMKEHEKTDEGVIQIGAERQTEIVKRILNESLMSNNN